MRIDKQLLHGSHFSSKGNLTDFPELFAETHNCNAQADEISSTIAPCKGVYAQCQVILSGKRLIKI